MMHTALLLATLSIPVPGPSTNLPASMERLSVGEWLSYEVPLEESAPSQCCYDWGKNRTNKRGCVLGAPLRGFGSERQSPNVDSDVLKIFLRRGASGLDRVLAISGDCPVDTTGQKVTSLTNVSDRASVEYLKDHVTRAPKARSTQSALAAIAHHATPKATQALARLTKADASVKKNAFFWLAVRRGEPGFETIRTAIESETSKALLRHLVFCLSQSPVAAAKETLKGMARRHARASLQSEALFWLAQQNDPDAESIGLTVIDEGPSRAVKKKAVFALSQLPAERSIPVLKTLVRSKRPRVIRREALFWLAQMDDDRALDELDQMFDATP